MPELPNGSVRPTPWQLRTMWAALTGLSLFIIAGIAVYVIRTFAACLSFLQPLLVPVAVAAIMAYLLDPVVNFIVKHGAARTKAVLYVFTVALLVLVALGFWVGPQLYRQSVDLGTQIPKLVDNAQHRITDLAQKYQSKYAANQYSQQAIQQVQAWANQQLPELPQRVWTFISSSVTGFLGFSGFLLSLIVVPIYLFFFLRDASTISRRWSDYLPLRSSAFKDEVVACLTEINSYLVAFFRGQILVTTIDGTILGLLLFYPLQLHFALLIGLLVAVLQLVPYMGILLCWIPAVLIALAQFGDWQHPLMVTVLFIAVSNLDGFFIAPRIVGEAVGLHPVTIILSVFLWTLLIGGLLGALLAVPLTATLKVLLRRYVWERTISRRQVSVPVPVPGGGSVTIDVPQ